MCGDNMDDNDETYQCEICKEWFAEDQIIDDTVYGSVCANCLIRA